MLDADALDMWPTVRLLAVDCGQQVFKAVLIGISTTGSENMSRYQALAHLCTRADSFMLRREGRFHTNQWQGDHRPTT